MMDTGLAFKDTKKNKIFLWMHEFFAGLSQWFINHCDMESYELTQALWAEMLEGVKVDLSDLNLEDEKKEIT